MTTRIAVAASNSLATAAGVRLAESGGNAVDAALAAILVSTVCEPGIASLLGGAFVTVAPAGGSAPVTVDGYTEMPGRGLPRERFGRGVRTVVTEYGGGTTMEVGHGSVATPGAVAAFEEAHRRYGRAPWAEVVAPVVEAARAGFPMGQASAYYLGHVHESVYGWQPDSFAALHDAAGRPLEQGELVHVPHLADSLELIGREGWAALATGDLARAISRDMAANDGLLTADDLAAYRPVVRPALALDLPAADGTWSLATNPAPAVGGPVLAALLLALVARRRARTGSPLPAASGAERIADLVEAQRAVLSFRRAHLDTADDRVAVAAELVGLLRGEQDGGADDPLAAVVRAAAGSPSTVHVSVVDADGSACAVTASSGYGSGVIAPGTGLWLNNCLGEQELNRKGLHAWEPGDRLPSNMAPTVGRRDDGAVLAVGSPGSDRITSAVQQVLDALAGGATPAEAVDRPRVHVRFGDDGEPVLEHEADLEVPDLGLPTRVHARHAMYFGGVGLAVRGADGALSAAGDPRRASAVAISH